MLICEVALSDELLIRSSICCGAELLLGLMISGSDSASTGLYSLSIVEKLKVQGFT